MGPFLLDHKLVSAVLNIKKPPTEKETLSVCKLKCITDETFKAALNDEAIDLTYPVDTVLHQLNDELCKALDTIAPLREIQVAVHQRQPWFDEVVKAQHKVVQNRSGFGINILNLIPRRPIKRRGIYTTDSSTIKKKQLMSMQVIDSKGNTKKLYKLTCTFSLNQHWQTTTITW